MARKPLFVVFDGPKGTGKTTLLEHVQEQLAPYMSVACMVEKELDPFRPETSRLLQEHRGQMTLEAERLIVTRLADGRAWITKNVLVGAASEVILMDRWYPADAVFRQFVPFEECLTINHERGVLEPDLVVATVCEPGLAWQRAHVRERGLASVAIYSFEQHYRSVQAFEAATSRWNWLRVPTEASPAVLAAQVCSEIERLMSLSKP